MPVTSRVALLIAVGLTIEAAGQPYTVTYDFQYSTPILQPGQSQVVSIYASTSFSAGKPYIIQNCTKPFLNGTQGILRGLSNSLFDVVNLANAEHGTFSNFGVPYPWNLQGYNNVPGTPDGLGGIKDIVASQAELLQIPDPPYGIPYELQEPALIWQGIWTPEPGFAGEVVLTPQTSAKGTGISPTVYVESGQLQYWVGDRWTAVYKPASFAVVPSPGAGAVGFLGFVLGRRRRR